MWIIDFPPGTTEAQAALYEAPFEYVVKTVKPKREKSRTTIDEWWMHERPRVEMRKALKGLARYIAITLGVLQSRIHEIWARRKGTQLRERESGFRYTPTTTFETFPFPVPIDEHRTAKEEAAKYMSELREAWVRARPDRTMTRLYNEQPTWLKHAHKALDEAVAAAYGWPPDVSEHEILHRLFDLNTARG